MSRFRKVREGRALSVREQEVYMLVVREARSDKDIASELGISKETVARHLKNIMDKKGMSSRMELTIQFYAHYEIPGQAALELKEVLAESLSLVHRLSSAIANVQRELEAKQ